MEEGFGFGSDGNTEIVVFWITVSLAAGNETASIAAVAIGALRGGKWNETSAHAHALSTDCGFRDRSESKPSRFHAMMKSEMKKFYFERPFPEKMFNGTRLRDGKS